MPSPHPRPLSPEGRGEKTAADPVGVEPTLRRFRRHVQTATPQTGKQSLRQESNLVPDLRRVVCRPVHSEESELGGRDSNPDFLLNRQARYLYNTPQKLRAPSGSRTRTTCLEGREAARYLMGASNEQGRASR